MHVGLSHFCLVNRCFERLQLMPLHFPRCIDDITTICLFLLLIYINPILFYFFCIHFTKYNSLSSPKQEVEVKEGRRSLEDPMKALLLVAILFLDYTPNVSSSIWTPLFVFNPSCVEFVPVLPTIYALAACMYLILSCLSFPVVFAC